MKPAKLMTIMGATAMVIKAGASTYQIQEGDTLSDIIYQKDLKPIYGKNGYLNKIIKLNRDILKKKGSLLLVGQLIQLPDDKMENKEVAAKEVVNPSEVKQVLADQSIAAVPQGIAVLLAPSNDHHPYSYFKLSPYFSSLKVDSTNLSKFGGTNVTLLSKKGVGVGGSWNIAYDEKKTFFGFASMEYYSLIDDPSYTFNKSTQSRMHFGMGALFQTSPELELSTSFAMREISFLDVRTPSNIDVSSVVVPELKLGVSKTILAKEKFSAKVGGHLMGLIPNQTGSYYAKMGYGGGVQMELHHADKSLLLIYDFSSQKIGEIKNNESVMTMLMNFSLGITQ